MPPNFIPPPRTSNPMRSWTWKFAARESRARWRHLALYSAPVALAAAAVVAIASLGNDLRQAVETQAKALLGADLVIASSEPFPPEAEELFRSVPGQQAREISFASMISFPKNGGTRLVQIRAVSDQFPFYGQLETDPPKAPFHRAHAVVLEQTLLQQFDLRPGDAVKIGNWTAPIAGALLKIPGENFVFSSFAPRVFIPFESLEATRLLQSASLARFRISFKVLPEFPLQTWLRRHQRTLESLHLSWETVESRKQNLGRAMENLYSFLRLASLVGLFLGAIGTASAVQLQFEEKAQTAALLRCLGARSSEAFSLFLLEALALTLVSVLGGAALGIALHHFLPSLFSRILPLSLVATFSWGAVARAVAVGFLTAGIFALLPLAPLRRVSALDALRSASDIASLSKSDAATWVLRILAGLAMSLLAISQAPRWREGMVFAAALFAVFAAFAALAQAIFWIIRKALPQQLPYVWRQGLANLHRPRNRTRLILFSAGFGIFLLLTLAWVQQSMVRGMFPEGPAGSPDTVLFDIQPDQLAGVKALLAERQLPVLQENPIITMRLAAINGKSTGATLRSKRNRHEGWALRREYRSTSQSQLSNSEHLVAGTWISQVAPSTNPIPVSVETGIAKELNVTLGDSLLFNIEGVDVETKIASLREVDWRRLQPNFFIVFPSGSLEQAPRMHIIVTRAGSALDSGRLQRELVRTFPNVSVIDLALILRTIESVLDKIAFASRFLALLTVAVGLLIVAFSILAGRYQRLQESVLLRTLGATRRQVLAILAIEYAALGSAASITGIALAAAASWALCHYLLKIDWQIPMAALWGSLAAGTAAITLIGLFTTWGLFRQPPLVILRSES